MNPVHELRRNFLRNTTATLADELTRHHHPVSDRTVAALLKQAGYSLQANQKTREGASHPDRDAQFTYLNACVRRLHRRGDPAVSVDTKKKGLWLAGDSRTIRGCGAAFSGQSVEVAQTKTSDM